MGRTKIVSDTRQRLLEMVGEYRALTTAQLHQRALPHLSYNTVYRHLAALRDMGLVTSHPLTPERGDASSFYWLLTKAGAMNVGTATGYTKAARRRPTRSHFDDLQTLLRLEERVTHAGWALLKPVRYSRHRPRPTLAQMASGDAPPQVQTLIAVIADSERRALDDVRGRDPHHPHLAQRQDDYAARLYESAVYAAAPNEYLAYRTGARARAILMIVPPPNAGVRFWQGRIDRYSRLLRYTAVYAVFGDDNSLAAHRPYLADSGFVLRTVMSIGRPPHPSQQPDESGLKPATRAPLV